jgi:hypothetical protein
VRRLAPPTTAVLVLLAGCGGSRSGPLAPGALPRVTPPGVSHFVRTRENFTIGWLDRRSESEFWTTTNQTHAIERVIDPETGRIEQTDEGTLTLRPIIRYAVYAVKPNVLYTSRQCPHTRRGDFLFTVGPGQDAFASDPVDFVRIGLEIGSTHYAGTQTVDGQPALRFVDREHDQTEINLVRPRTAIPVRETFLHPERRQTSTYTRFTRSR